MNKKLLLFMQYPSSSCVEFFSKTKQFYWIWWKRTKIEMDLQQSIILSLVQKIFWNKYFDFFEQMQTFQDLLNKDVTIIKMRIVIYLWVRLDFVIWAAFRLTKLSLRIEIGVVLIQLRIVDEVGDYTHRLDILILAKLCDLDDMYPQLNYLTLPDTTNTFHH
jgi:hypothetical protein